VLSSLKKTYVRTAYRDNDCHFRCNAVLSSSPPILDEVLGELLTVLSGIGWASYMVISRYYLRAGKIDVLVLISYSMSLARYFFLGQLF